MYKLIAGAAHPAYTGEVASQVCATLEEAEALMRDWALFGVNNMCSETNSLRIFDQKGELVRTWNRRLRKAV